MGSQCQSWLQLKTGRLERRMAGNMGQIQVLLRQLGVTENYRGFSQTACAVELCREEPERLELVTKWVYPMVAAQCGTSWCAVERNIRTVREVIWARNRSLLEELSPAPLLEMPYPAQLLSILASSPVSGPLVVHGLSEAVALAGEDHNVGVMDQAVDEGGSQAVVIKNGVPPGNPPSSPCG